MHSTNSQRRDQPCPIPTPVRYTVLIVSRAAPSCGAERVEGVLPAIGSQAQANKRGFGRAVAAAQARLDLIEEDQT